MNDHDDDSLFPEASAEEGELLGELLSLAPSDLDVPPERAARTEAFLWNQWQFDLRRSRRRRTVLWGVAALAAGLLLVLGLPLGPRDSTPAAPAVARLELVRGAVRVHYGSDAANPQVGDAIGAGAVLETGEADRAALRLEGGAGIRLDTDSRVKLASASTLVLETGALYFDAEVTSAGPVTIHTPFGIVRHLGTQFEVRHLGDGVRVRVREGEVRVEHPSGVRQARAGVELELTLGGVEIRPGVSPSDPAWSWVLEAAPGVDLEDPTLADYLIWLGRETGWQIRFEDQELARRAPSTTIVGTIAGLRPDLSPDVILPACDLTHRLEGATIIIERP